ncbi:MAG: triose-phosphate isomerase [Firmicutes bacterium]|jgi:triosephosphate isomerase|nr:triose-phosphate isomerase [Bacillota bacterium]
MRTPIIAANWKMHKTTGEAQDFMHELAGLLNKGNLEVVICPPFPLLGLVAEAGSKYGIFTGAQNMYWETEGAYTGEVSPLLLKDLNVTFVIIGHSERRHLFGETDQQVARKIKAAFAHNLTPILCVGETLQQRQAGETMAVVSEQVNVALTGLDPSQVRRMIIAYEPVWAIGSGLAATGKDANEVAAQIRKTVAEMFSLKVARDIRIQYGGSVKPENIMEFMQEAEIDGALVGGASLAADKFAAMINRVAGEAVS